MANGIAVRIRNFEKYKGRKDVEHNSWFRCSNRLLEDPDFFDFSAAEILAWIYILSLASQKNSDAVYINFDHAERVCRLKKRDVESALKKLNGNQLDPAGVTSTLRPRNGDDTSTCATDITNKQTDITNKTVCDVERRSPSPTQVDNPEDILSVVPKEKQASWPTLYPETEFVPRELIKILDWCRDNPSKKPRSTSGWSRFVGGWLERGWERHRKSLPTNQPGSGDLNWDKIFEKPSGGAA